MMMTRKLSLAFPARQESRAPAFILFIAILHLFAIFLISADAALTINVRDRAGKPASPVRVQLFPGALAPDSDVQPIAPPQPRPDGLVGFVTNPQGRVTVDLPAGEYTVVASPDLDSGQVTESFLIVRAVNAPGEVTLSVADTVPVTVKAVGESDFAAGTQPLEAARTYFRPSKRVLGYVGLLNNNGELKTSISPGRYHVVLNGSIALHYVVLANQVISPPSATVSFNGAVQPTARLALDLPPTTQLVLYEVLSTNITSEFVDIVENTIGYDAAYTEVLSLGFGKDAETTRLLPGLTYQLNLSYVVDLNGVLYAYELRINALRVDEPRSYRIGNSGDQPFKLTARIDAAEYHPGDSVTVRYELFDTQGNQLYRFFNFSGARLIFPFVVVRDPNGVVVGSNPNTNELPEDFFRFQFRLPPTAQPGVYTGTVSLDAKMYGQLEDRFSFRVVAERDQTPPRISNVDAPTTAEANAPIKISAQIEDESGVNKLTLEVGSGANLSPILLPNNRYEWEIPANLVSPPRPNPPTPFPESEGGFLPSPSGEGPGERLRWQLTAVDAFGNSSTTSGEIEIRDTTAPSIEHTPIEFAEIGVELPISAKVADNVDVAEVVVSYKNERMAESANLQICKFADLQICRFAIPASALKGDALRYFLRATDSAGNVRRLPENGEFTIRLRDTTPPMIYHTPITATANGPIQVEAVVLDNDTVDGVVLNYRRMGDGTFTRLPMTPNVNTYTATIPASALTPGSAEYFLEASDPSGNSARLPEGAETYQIRQDLRPLIAQLELSPSAPKANPLPITVGAVQPFRFRAMDADGHFIPVLPIWSATNGIGEIDQEGRFYAATTAGRIGQVIATIPVLATPPIPPAGGGGKEEAAQQAITWVQLTPAPAERILMSPPSPLTAGGEVGDAVTPIMLAAGSQQAFQSLVLDVYGNSRADAVTWRVEGGIGDMVGTTFHAQKIGRGRIVATSGALSTFAEVDVSFGKLAKIDLRPTALHLRAGESQPLEATGLDSSGNRVSLAPLWLVRGGVGSIRLGTAPTFIAGSAGEGEVVATIGDLTTTVPVRVTPGPLVSITTNPFITYLPLSTDKLAYVHQCVASGWDIAGNPVPIRDLRWTVDAAAGTIDPTGLMTSIKQVNTQTLGNIVINGTIWAFGKSETGLDALPGKSVVVIQKAPPKPIQRLEVTLRNFDQRLTSFTLAVGESQKFEANGVDQNNQTVSVFPNWSVVGDVGVIQPDGLFTATQPGRGMVIATERGRTAQMRIEVTQGVLSSLAIEPPYLTLLVGESFRLGVSGADAFGNPVPIDDNRLIWSITPPSSTGGAGGEVNTPIATMDANGLLHAIRPGTARIEARIGDVVAHAQLFVHPQMGSEAGANRQASESTQYAIRNLASRSADRDEGTQYASPIEVYPSPLQLERGRTQQFRAYGRDASGNRVELADVAWRVTNGLGSIDARGMFSAENAGEGLVLATFEGRTGTAYTMVADLQTPQSIRALIIVPQVEQSEIPFSGEPVTLMVGNTQVFYTLGVFYPSPTLGEAQSLPRSIGGVRAEVRPTLAVWNVSGGIGVIDAMGRFVAATPGQGEVRATVNGVSVACPVIVQPSPPNPLSKLGALWARLGRGGEGGEGTGVRAEDRPHFGRRIGELVEFRVSPSSARIRAGDSLRFTVFGIDAAGNRSAVRPNWQVISDANIGRMGTDGLFIANQVGSGRIVARLGSAGASPSPQQITIEVIPNRPAFARLEPSEVVIKGASTGGAPLELIAFDWRGTRAELPSESVTWKVIGNVGAISTGGSEGKAIFNPVPNPSTDLIGEVIALIPNTNWVGRARIFRYAKTDAIAQAWIEPSDIELPIGGQFQFRWITQDAMGRVIDSTPTWKVVDASTGTPRASISGAGRLTIDDNVPVGTTLRVIGDLPSPPASLREGQGVRAEARVRIIAAPIAKIELENLTGKSTPDRSGQALQIGESARFRARGFDRRGNSLLLSPKWSVSPNIGDIEVSRPDATEAILTARTAGAGELRVAQDGTVAVAPFIVVSPPSTGDLRIGVAASTQPISGTGSITDPLLLKAGTVVSFIALSGSELVRPIWTVTPSDFRSLEDFGSLEGLGQISTDGVLTTRYAGNGTVMATLNDVSAQLAIRITPGNLAMLRVEPQMLSVLSTPRQTSQVSETSEVYTRFSVTGFDLYGNPLPASGYAPPRWSVTGGIGTVGEGLEPNPPVPFPTREGGDNSPLLAGEGTGERSVIFTPAPVSPGTAITGTVVAASEGIYGSASVTVISEFGTLALLELIPESTRVAANQSIEIRIIGRDDKGHPLPTLDTPIIVRLTPEVGTIAGAGNRWSYRAPTRLPGESSRLVNLRAETSSGTPIVSTNVPITLVPANLAALQIEPESVTVRAGDAQAFRLTAADGFGNAINPTALLLVPNWSLSNPIGELADTTRETGTYRAKQVGTTRITVRSGAVVASAQIQITPGALVSLKISPEAIVVPAGDTVEFRLSGVDAQGNRLEGADLTPEPIWRIIGFNDSANLEPSPQAPDRRLWKPNRAGKGVIEARWTDDQTEKILTAQATVQVTAGKLSSLEIQLMDNGRPQGGPLQPPYVLISGGRYPLKAVGRDAFDNEIDVQVTWNLAGNLGQIVILPPSPTLGEGQSLPRSIGGVRGEGPLLEAVFVGEGSLLANADGIHAEVKLSIKPSTASIGKSGGRLESPAGLVLDVPAGALNSERHIEISIIESPGAALKAQQITRVVEIRPRKEILKRPAQLTFSYAGAIVNGYDPAKLSLYFWDDFQEKWIPVSSRVDATAQTVSASVNHFAPYTLMASDTIIQRSKELRIDGVKLTPPVFYAPETNRLTIEYLLNAPDTDEANVTLKIYDFRDERVVTLLERVPRRIGRNAEQWDGRVENGETVRNGRYVLVLIAEAGGRTVAEKKLLVVFK